MRRGPKKSRRKYEENSKKTQRKPEISDETCRIFPGFCSVICGLQFWSDISPVSRDTVPTQYAHFPPALPDSKCIHNGFARNNGTVCFQKIAIAGSSAFAECGKEFLGTWFFVWNHADCAQFHFSDKCVIRNAVGFI